MKNHLKIWLKALRLRTLPLAAAGIILGCAIAFAHNAFYWSILFLALLTTFLLQILSNLANDFGDFSHGTDNDKRVGPVRTVQSGAIRPETMKKAMFITAVLAFICGVTLLYFAFGNISFKFLLFFITGLLGIAAAIKYTVGKSNFGYKGFGDIMVLIFFGPIAVGGVYFLQTKALNWSVMLPSFSIGLLSAGVLNVNNLRDHENDKLSNKNTMVVRLGFYKGKIMHYSTIVLGIVFMLIFFILEDQIANAFWLIIPLLILGLHTFNVWKTKEPAMLDPELKRLALTTFLFAIVSSIILML